MLEVDLEFPDGLHKLYKKEKLEISQNTLSNYCSSVPNEYCTKIGGVNKLVPNLSNKSKYVFHYRTLQMF